MYAGKVVETGKAEDIFFDPRHPYTWGLLSSMPDLTGDKKERLYTIPGNPPNLANEVKGDAFAVRNPYALNIDFEEEPPMFEINEHHQAATWLLHPDAPKVEMPQTLKRELSSFAERKSDMQKRRELMAQTNEPLLSVKGLKQYFPVSKKFTVRAVDNISFDIYPGETYGLVGESGSGKSTTGRSIIRLYDPTEGTILFNGEDISKKLTAKQEKMLRSDMQMVFQDPMASLNPHKKILDTIAMGLDAHNPHMDQNERVERVSKMMEMVGLNPAYMNRYPNQFSGGQRQRIGLGRALIMNPKLVIADEAISALDVSIQAQVVNLMKDIQKKQMLHICLLHMIFLWFVIFQIE